MPAASPPLLDRFRGCLLGQAVGDGLGAPFETMPADAIYYGYGSALKIVSAPPMERLEYTDDTQMMIGVAETLAECGHIDQDCSRARLRPRRFLFRTAPARHNGRIP